MKFPFAPLIGLIAAYGLACFSLISGRGNEHEVIATCFKIGQAPSGWTSRADHDFDFLMGVMILPWFFPIVGTLYFMMCWRLGWKSLRMDSSTSPNRKRRIRKTLLAHGVWFVCIMVIAFTLSHQSVIQANKTHPAEMPVIWAFGQMALPLGGFMVWLVTLFMRIYPQPLPED